MFRGDRDSAALQASTREWFFQFEAANFRGSIASASAIHVRRGRLERRPDFDGPQSSRFFAAGACSVESQTAGREKEF